MQMNLYEEHKLKTIWCISLSQISLSLSLNSSKLRDNESFTPSILNNGVFDKPWRN